MLGSFSSLHGSDCVAILVSDVSQDVIMAPNSDHKIDHIHKYSDMATDILSSYQPFSQDKPKHKTTNIIQDESFLDGLTPLLLRVYIQQ